MQRLRIRHLSWPVRVAFMWIIDSCAFAILLDVIPGIAVTETKTAVLVIIISGFLNATLRLLLVKLNIRPNLFNFGFATLFLNSFIVWLVAQFPLGIIYTDLLSPFFLVIGITAVNVPFSDLLAIDDDESYYHHIVSNIIKLYGMPENSEIPGVLFMEIDGLSKTILQRALDEGYMPTLARWLDGGTHKLVGWECDLSSQTSASQAGILLGDNFDIPAFRWYEKESGRLMVSNHPADTYEIERRLSNGYGLLSNNGASRSNLFSGDAPQTMFTFSTISDATRHRTQDFYPLYMGPFNFCRILILFLWDVLLEKQQALYQRRHDVQPRIHRGGIYPLLRASTTVLLRDLSVYILIGDMYAGLPAIYVTFFGYDEVAHHSGIDRPDAFDILSKLDDQFDRLEATTRLASRPYQLVVLSDHGQSQGATFKQRYGETLEDVVRGLVTEENTVQSIQNDEAGWGNLNIFLTDLLHDVIFDDDHILSRFIRRLLKRRVYLDQVVFGPYRKWLAARNQPNTEDVAEIIVLASGNLGLIYLTDWEHRLSYEEMTTRFPNLLKGLTQHEGISFVLVQSEKYGAMVIGANGIRYLEDENIEGCDPLAHFGPNAADHLRRTSSFPHVADIMVNSCYDPETGEVAAFEELVGSHGGLGGDQSAPFLLFPAEWDLDDDNIIGASMLHDQMKTWLNQYSDEVAIHR